MIHIVIADDDCIIREGMRMILETQNDFIIDAVCENGEEAVAECLHYKPQVALFDIRMPVKNGIEAAKEVLQKEGIKVLLLTTFDEPDLILEAMKASVHGYILKSSSAEKIISAIRTVALGGSVYQKDVMDFITKQIGEPVVGTRLFDELTEREHEVASLISKGFTNKEIGEQLFISDGTVRNHISVILNKTGLSHRTQIALRYLERKINE